MEISRIFIKICNMSLAATYCIVAVLALRLILRKWPKIFSYMLWSVVLFRLLCPVSATGGLSLLRMNVDLLSEERLYGNRASDNGAWHGPMQEDGTIIEGGDAVAEKNSPIEEELPYRDGNALWMHRALVAVGILWLLGILALGTYSIWSALRLRRHLAGAKPEEEGIYVAQGFDSPFVFGFFRPRIYLPEGLEGKERQLVIAHEQVHVARRDYLIKILAWCALCIHWFNPAVWLAYKLAERDMEMSCDEAVIKKLGLDARKEYSSALLAFSCDGKGSIGCPVSFGESGVKNRVRNILQYRKRTIVAMGAVAAILCLVLVGLAINPMGSDAKANEQASFVTEYAEAFLAKDGDAIVSLYMDENAAYESVPELDKADGGYIFGYSSPWPDEYRFTIEPSGDAGSFMASINGEESESKAQIRYYAWTSDPHISVWREDIAFKKTKDGYKVTKAQLKWLDNISTMEEFEQAYGEEEDGMYRFADYGKRGYPEAINNQAKDDLSAGMPDRNTVYRNPETAAPWILNLSGGESELAQRKSDGQVVVRYTFANGDEVLIPMYDANYGQASSAAGTGESQTDDVESQEVWLVPETWWAAR